ncbi:MAG: hypothetical protein GF317_10170 [Candidatus Lokiarchaeota archaeon]|nr:hypothetical protein [Candidatus Lokiarchaeota archaeon]MBD3200025.1 hypothetical protein [Candidatus Lokiarchaeota archaeon]
MTQSRSENEPEFEFGYAMLIFLVIGFITSWINMIIIYDTQIHSTNEILKIFSYLSIIFTTSIPCIGIGLKNRLWGYSYIIGFAVAGIPFMFLQDLFIGGYTFATTIFIFAIMWLIFWKTWRSLSDIKTIQD